MEQPSHEAATSLEQHDEVRCPKCKYFLCQRILVEGRSILKFVCKSCKVRLLVSLTPDSVNVGLV